MRHASVTTTEKYYVGIQSDETSALLAGLMASGVAQGEHSPKKVNGEVNETKKGSRVIGNPLFFNVSAGTRTQDLRIKSPARAFERSSNMVQMLIFVWSQKTTLGKWMAFPSRLSW